MKKNIIILLIILILSSCNLEKNTSINPEEATGETSEKVIQVTSSIIPISSVIHTIGGDFVEVHTIIPAGVSPHGFDLSVKDVVVLENSEITFLIGLEQIDGFLEKPLENKKHVELAEGMELIGATAHNHSEDVDVHEDEHNVDAHVWLGEENILEIAGKIRAELIAIMPEQSATFIKNTEIFTQEVSSIYETFRIEHEGQTPREFIVFHDAYNYMMQSAGIDLDLKVPFSQNVLHETGSAHMVELIEEIELHGVQNIFTEPQFSDGNLQKFALQYNLTVATLDPLGTDPSANGYLENLKINLDNLSLIYE